MIALAGPNGAGKSTFYDSQLADMGLPFVNADILAHNAGIDAYEAAKSADLIRRELLASRASFVFETVFSDPVGDKLEFIKTAIAAGYGALLIFIGIQDPAQSDARVSIRVSQGGHDVPSEKLVERFPRILTNLKRSLAELPNIHVYENSDLSRPYRLVALKEHGKGVQLIGATPGWLEPLLPSA